MNTTFQQEYLALKTLCDAQELENQLIIKAIKEEMICQPKIKSCKEMMSEKKQQIKMSKNNDKVCLNELKKMAKIFSSVVKVEKKQQKKIQQKEKKLNSVVMKTLPSLCKLFGEKRPKKIVSRKTKKVIIVSEKQVDSICQNAIDESMSILSTQDSVSVSPVYEQNIIECESNEEYECMIASGEQSDHDNDDDQDDLCQENRDEDQNDLCQEDKDALKIYNQYLKKSKIGQVCGKRNAAVVPPKKSGKNLIDFPEQKKFFELDKNQITYHLVKKSLMSTINEDLIMKEGQQKIEEIAQKKIRSALSKFNNGKQMNIIIRYKLEKDFAARSTKINNFTNAVSSLIKIFKADSEQYTFDVKDLGITIIQYNTTFAKDRQERVRGGRLIIDMNSQYLIISPQSNTNCFYQCLVYQMLVQDISLKSLPYWELLEESQEKAHNWIVKTAEKFKAQTGNKKDYSDKNDVQDVCSYYGTKITVYDNLFQIHKDIGIIKPLNFKKDRKSSLIIGQDMKMQFANGHCMLMVNRRLNEEFCQKFVVPAVEKKQNQTCEPILPRKLKPSKVQRKIMTFDIESYKKTIECGTQVAFAIGICTDFNTETKEYEYKEFYSENCISEFLDYLSDMKVDESEVYIYSHNGAKFDLHIINEELLRRTDFTILKPDFVSLNGAVISQKIINSKGQIIVFRDSARIFAGSLDGLCKDLKPHFRKQSEHNFKFDELNSQNVFVEGSMKDEISEYLRHDCLSLAEIMITFRQQLLKDEKIEIDICDCFTSATLAKKLYFSKYYYKYCGKKLDGKQKRKYIYEVTNDIDSYLRQSYFGGRCDIYGYGKFLKCYYYDFTSLYPAMGAFKMYPFGEPKFVNGEDIDLYNFFGFIRCRVYTNPDVIPLHGFKQNGRLTFANHSGTEMTLFSEEIKFGLDLGYEYDVIDGYEFDKCPLLKNIMEDGFKNKAQAKQDGQPVMEKTWKIMINSAYGFWGLNWQDKRGVQFVNGEQLSAHLDDGSVYNYTQIKEDEYMADIEQDLQIKGKSIAIASACTSYARMELYSAMHAITKKGFQIYYTDTDSIITECDISQFPDLMERFMPDGCGNALGSLKNEALDYCKKKLSPENLKKQKEIDGGELSFDECQILGPKMYSLKKTLVDGQVIEICKMKGMKDSTYEDQSELLNGSIMLQSITQFKSGKNLYLMDQQIEGRVKVQDQIKKVNLYHMEGDQMTDKNKYSKGYIQGQKVMPFYFKNGVLIE